jgi:membrane-bound serine protease (ClpP class)
MTLRLSYLLLTIFLLTSLFSQIAPADNSQDRYVLQLNIEEVIGPATGDYITRAIERAPTQQVGLILIRMDTPGGLDSAMRSIIKAITNSPVPVVTYVAPTGSRAASAGTYILYASHVAAMAPGTNLGAATPVNLGGPGQPDSDEPKSDKQPETNGKSASERKAINDAVAYIRSLAELRGRNADWAEQAVRQAASLSANAALEKNVIDLMARSTTDLLQKLDGQVLDINGQKQTLHTLDMTLKTVEPDWRSRLLSVITNPNIAYILMLVGIYGLIFEFSNPGAVVPGTVGAICLLLGLYALQLLPINYAGMALLLLGIALMIGEAYQPSFGILGIGGLVAFVFGSIILIDTDAPGYGVDIGVIAAFSISSILMFIVVIGMALKARRKPVVSGMEQLLTGTGTVTSINDDQIYVLIHGEHWRAVSPQPLKPGQKVRVTGSDGLTLQVEPANESLEKEQHHD